MNIGEKLKHIRTQQGLSMNAFSRQSGVPQSTISEVEAGKRQPTFEVLEKIILSLGYSLSEFFTDDNTGNAITPKQQELLRTFDNLNDKQKSLIIAIAKEMS